MTKEQVVKGSILGVLVGDAVGSTLEFLPDTPTRSQVKQAISMVGGVAWRTAPGQIIDAGEMVLCHMLGLVATQTNR